MESPASIHEYLRKRIQNFRLQKGLSVEEFAHLTGMAPTSLYSLESGSRSWSVQTVGRLSNVFRLPYSYWYMDDPVESFHVGLHALIDQVVDSSRSAAVRAQDDLALRILKKRQKILLEMTTILLDLPDDTLEALRCLLRSLSLHSEKNPE